MAAPMLFYDAAGSEWFERICDLPEYYLTRTEHALLQAHAQEIARHATGDIALVELGSGSARKTRLLIEALLARQGALTYVPVDISASALTASARRLLADYPRLRVHAHATDYETGIERLSRSGLRQKMVLFLGSSLGNLDWSEAVSFLRHLKRQLRHGDSLLLGVDLQKDVSVLEAAYDDPQGVTADFNRNVLRRINRELGADFVIEGFAHRAFYNAEEGRIEMHLESRRCQVVHVRDLDCAFRFDEGETIHTESSYKYDERRLGLLFELSGLRLVSQWRDAERPYCLSLLAPI
jgi:L-histidine N-alpha-methyltransferase